MINPFTDVTIKTDFIDKINVLNENSRGFLQEDVVEFKPVPKPATENKKNVVKKSSLTPSYTKFTKTQENSIQNIIPTINKLSEDTWYTLKSKLGRIDSFYNAILSILDENYCTYKTREKTRNIQTLKQKMAVDLSDKNLYRLFRYHHNREFKRSTLENALNDNKTDEITRRYLSDYFNINIICINRQTRQSKLYREKFHKTVSIMVIFEGGDTYTPVLSDTGNHFVHPDEAEKILQQFVLETPPVVEKKSKKTEKSKYKTMKLSELDYSKDKFKLYSISRYSLAELQTISEENDLPIHNISELKSGEKRVKNKTKRELYDAIQSLTT